jgi:prophage regulatory protein
MTQLKKNEFHRSDDDTTHDEQPHRNRDAARAHPESKAPGLSRLKSIIKPGGPLEIGRSTWWAGVKSGRFPSPLRFSSRLVLWRDTDIQRLIENGVTNDERDEDGES